MTDDLRAAVERLRENRDRRRCIPASCCAQVEHQEYCDLMAVRNAYLNEHPSENVQACPYCGITYQLRNDGLAINLAEHIMRAHSDT